MAFKRHEKTGVIIPERFWTVHYNGKCIPNDDHDLSKGANCQRFAYALLAENGLALPPLRSSDLWNDTEHTKRVLELEPLDMLLFHRVEDAYGAHMAVYIGEDRAIHLSKRMEIPEIRELERFASDPQYRFFIGAKRALLPQPRRSALCP